ncbi:MAG: hypothetical protein ACQETC_10560 [Thermodesulfobacteriota bacterium]
MITLLKIKDTVLHTWLWIAAMVCIILGVGVFTFFVVSDKGKPSWDYRPVKSVPSESPYAVYPKQPAGQHVNGREAAE